MLTYEYRCDRYERKSERMMTLGEHKRRPRPSCPKCNSRKTQQIPASFQAVTGKKT